MKMDSTTTMRHARSHGPAARRRRLCGVAAVALLLGGLAACGSDGDGGSATDVTEASTSAPESTAASTSDVGTSPATTPDTDASDTTVSDTVADTEADTVPDATDAADTTDATDATAPATDPDKVPPTVAETAVTQAPTTTVADAFPRGWQPVGQFPQGVYSPLEESNWMGVPSPALPTSPGQPLADGLYPINAEWDPADPTSLIVEVQRLVPCIEAPEFACIRFEGPFQPGEVGVDDSVSYPMTVPLDGSIGIGLVGYACTGVAAQGNGADLASLFLAWNEAYHRTLAPQVEAGADDFTVMEAIAAAPTDGFAGANADCPDFGFGGLVFRTGDAPPVLHQIISRLDEDNQRVLLTATTVVQPHTVQVVDGKMTFYFYAGFIS